MSTSPEQVAAEQMRRLMQFPPDLMLWNAFAWASWSSWMSLWGFDLDAWTRMMAEPAPPEPKVPAFTPEPANDGVAPGPGVEPVQPSFA